MKPDRAAYNNPQYTAVVLAIISHNNINEHASVVENKDGETTTTTTTTTMMMMMMMLMVITNFTYQIKCICETKKQNLT